MSRDNIVFYDLETTGLYGNRGDILLTCAFLEMYGDEPFVIGNVEPPDDINVTIDVSEVLRRYNRIVGWNSHGFDLIFLNHRLKANGLRPFAHKGSFDLKPYAGELYPYLGGSQDDLSRALGIEHQKTPLEIERHIRIGNGDGTMEDYEYLVNHNKEDVLGLRELYREVVGWQ